MRKLGVSYKNITDKILRFLRRGSSLNSNADKVGGYDYNWDPSRPGHSKEMGYGRINTSRTLNAALAGKPPYISKKKSSKEMDIDETELNITAIYFRKQGM